MTATAVLIALDAQESVSRTAAGPIRIDLANTSVREANEVIRRYGADGTDVELVNPDARHHLGVGLVHPINVRIRGSAGYFCAGLTDAARFEVDNNVGWGVGDNMYSGRVVVRGNAGPIPGVAIRGAEIVVHGNMGSRAGQVMKAGTLACAGNANFMAGYMMYGGRIVILGDSGEKVGEDMTGGHIFVVGKVQDLGSDAVQVELDEGEDDDIRAFLDRYELRFTGTFTKIANAGKKLRCATSERQMRSIPFFTFSGASEYWNPKIQEDIYIKSQIGRCRIRGAGHAQPEHRHRGRAPGIVRCIVICSPPTGHCKTDLAWRAHRCSRPSRRCCTSAIAPRAPSRGSMRHCAPSGTCQYASSRRRTRSIRISRASPWNWKNTR